MAECSHLLRAGFNLPFLAIKNNMANAIMDCCNTQGTFSGFWFRCEYQLRWFPVRDLITICPDLDNNKICAGGPQRGLGFTLESRPVGRGSRTGAEARSCHFDPITSLCFRFLFVLPIGACDLDICLLFPLTPGSLAANRICRRPRLQVSWIRLPKKPNTAYRLSRPSFV
jgi:hypothetical protein